MNANPYDSALATVLRRKRAEAGLSQQETARRIGLTFQQVQKYEKGTNRAFFSRLVELAAVCGTTPERFIAEVREVLDAETPEAEAHDSRQTIEFVRLANAVPRHGLPPVLDLLRWIAKSVPDERPS